jgi:membrane protease YdiL (CAAX protease family)
MATRWALFAGVTLIVLLVVLGLSRATTRELTGPNESRTPPETSPPGTTVGDERGVEDAASPEERTALSPGADEHAGTDRLYARGDETTTGTSPEVRRGRTPRAGDPDLLVSAAFSQLLVGALLAGLAWYAEVPPGALGVDDPAAAVLPGVALGVGLYVANEAGAWLAGQAGMDADESLRELLAPESRGEWALLLLVVLPTVAGVEELLFRGALIGAFEAGFSFSPWLLAVLSSVAFGLGHGLQGPGGILVTGVLGFALAAAFVLTGSLWVVIVAHYLVNALEFLVHEGLGVEFGGP